MISAAAITGSRRMLMSLASKRSNPVTSIASQVCRFYNDGGTHTWMMPIKTIEVPTMGDSITEGVVVDLPVAIGEIVQADDVVIVLETDKVSVDVRAPESGAVTAILAELDDVVEVGSDLFKLDTDVATSAAATDNGPSKTNEVTPTQKTMSTTAATPATPAAATPPPAPAPALAAQKKIPVIPVPNETSVFLGARTERRTKMSRMRQRIAQRLKEAQNKAAMLTTFQECDMGNIMELRRRYKDAFEAKHGVKLGFNSAFIKAATAALQELPAVNAYIDDETKEIVFREYCDINVAVATPKGLVTPVLRNTETMSFAQIEQNIKHYADKARAGTLAVDDLTGGTFTVSNGGVFGSLMGTPIINIPQSAILGMHATKMRAVVNDKGVVVARPMMYLALTYDHRLIDGREGVTFLKSIAEKINDPTKLLLEL